MSHCCFNAKPEPAVEKERMSSFIVYVNNNNNNSETNKKKRAEESWPSTFSLTFTFFSFSASIVI